MHPSENEPGKKNDPGSKNQSVSQSVLMLEFKPSVLG